MLNWLLIKEYEAYTLLVTIELLKNDLAAAEKYANLAKRIMLKMQIKY